MNYLNWLEKLKISPNFWCSAEYIHRARLSEILQSWNRWLSIEATETDRAVMFPIIDVLNGCLTNDKREIWADFEGWEGEGLKPEFLDYEYIYNPKEFLTLTGGKWATFRKNSRKFPSRFKGSLRYDWVQIYSHHFSNSEESLTGLLLRWLAGQGENTEIYDDEVMLDYLKNGWNRKILWDEDGSIHGINIWDENYKYINFRYCFCRKEEFLSEYMRLLFYTDPYIQERNKLVNDGGTLDNPDLKFFKDKLNPLKVREVRSWK